MKMKLYSIALILLFGLTSNLFGQLAGIINPGYGFNKQDFPMFGKDIVIHDQPTQNQRCLDICSAYNGWLFAVYCYYQDYWGYISVQKSTDNGITWVTVYDDIYTLSWEIRKLQIRAAGNNPSDFKVFIGGYAFDNFGQRGAATLMRFNGDPFQYEDELLKDSGQNSYIRDFAIVTDAPYPAVNSSPYSIGIVYSRRTQSLSNVDTVIFKSSSNGGISLDGKKVITVTPLVVNHVAISYGRSSTYNTGNYFVAWQADDNVTSEFGHIYTSHTFPNFNGSFSSIKNIDSLKPEWINQLRHPVISCQNGNYDNDSSNTSEVILFEKKIENINQTVVKGCYSVHGSTSNNFHALDIIGASQNSSQPDLTFNEYDSTFMATWYELTTSKLPLYKKNVTLYNPNTWDQVSSGYNDSSNLSSPVPKVKVHQTQKAGINVWVSEGQGGNGIGLFDAQYSTYTGISKNEPNGSQVLISAYPNPCSRQITFDLNLASASQVTISVFNLLGKRCGSPLKQYCITGGQKIQYDVSNMENGLFIFRIQTTEGVVIGKFQVTK